MDSPIDGSVLAVLAAYQNNLVTSKMMTTNTLLHLGVLLEICTLVYSSGAISDYYYV